MVLYNGANRVENQHREDRPRDQADDRQQRLILRNKNKELDNAQNEYNNRTPVTPCANAAARHHFRHGSLHRFLPFLRTGPCPQEEARGMPGSVWAAMLPTVW